MADMKFSSGEFVKEVTIAGVVAAALDALRGGVQNGAKKVAAKVSEAVEKKFDECRDKMLAFIRGLAATDKKASENLWNQWKARQLCQKRNYGDQEPYKPGDENAFIERLTNLYTALDEPQERAVRVQVFKWLGRMPDEEFDLFLEFLNHDVVIQWIKRAWLWFKEAWVGVWKACQTFDKVVNQKLESAAKEIRTFREERIVRRYRT